MQKQADQNVFMHSGESFSSATIQLSASCLSRSSYFWLTKLLPDFFISRILSCEASHSAKLALAKAKAKAKAIKH